MRYIHEYIREILALRLRPGDILIMDTFNTIDLIQKKLKKYNLRLRRRGKELMPSGFERLSGITSDLMNEAML